MRYCSFSCPMYSSTCRICSGGKSLISSRRTSSSTSPCFGCSSDAAMCHHSFPAYR
nr:MAG TPA: hypothetical protein [Caudoviricetes sp.]